MVFFLLILLLLMFVEAKVAPEGAFETDYMSKDKTSAIKGIFVILIVFSHFSQYVTLGGSYDAPYLSLKAHLNQMVVAMFWFYSGYGIMESVTKKGFAYVKTIPTRRFLTVLLNFDLAILLFLIVGAFLGNTYSLSTILWSLIGWKSVGNSNWYIFATLVLYLLTFLSFLLLKWRQTRPAHYAAVMLLTVLTIVFVYVQMKMGRPGYCYNTLILFPLGCWYSLLRNKVETIIMRNDLVYALAGLLVLAAYAVSFRYRFSKGIEAYTVWAVAFTLLVVLITMKITFYNAFLTWFGNHVFSVYILQRIPMMILSHLGLAQNHKYVFLIVSFIGTIVLAMLFDWLTGKLHEKLYRARLAKG